MSPNQSLFAYERELRRLVRAQAMPRAQAALVLYCEELNRQLSSLPAGSEAQLELGRTAGELLNWVSLMVRSAQAHFCDELFQISQLSGYRQIDTPSHLELRV
ncbi:MAG: hypothetical protein ABI693_12615 [Bryobacteraceae bacterium]